MPAVNPCESTISNSTKYVPAVVKTCWAVKVEDQEASQTPSPSQSHRAWSVALGSGSVDEDASNATELFTLGYGGANVNRAVGGPGAATATATDAVWESVPFVPVTMTVYEPGVEPLVVHVDVWVPLMLTGTHEVVNPAGVDAAVRETAPLKLPVDWRESVEVADARAGNETVPGFAESVKSGPPALKNSNGEGAVTSPCPRLPPPQTSSISFSRE